MRPTTRFLLVWAACLVAGTSLPASAQYFGQNKVQYRDLDWSVLRSRHFEIYFHDGEREAAVDAGRMAERAYERLSTILDHELSERIPIILYASQTEFQQTNVTPSFIGEGTGGLTEFAKRRVTLPITGSYGDFDHVLTHELVHAFFLDVLSGGADRNLGGAFDYVPPLWFMEGCAEYLSLGEIDPLTEMWLRDGALKGYLTPLPVLELVGDIRVYRYGQAVVAYLGATYGDHAIGRILKQLPHARSVSRALEEVVGITLERFSEDWMEEVRRTYLPQIASHQKPEDFAFRLTDAARGDLSALNVTPAISPDGTRMIYFSDRSLYNDLYMASALTGRIEQRLIKSERQADFESLRFYRSAMDWHPDGKQVVFVALSKGRDALFVQRVRDGRIVEKIRPNLDGITSPSFSPDGKWIVFSGLQGGRSNLYRVRPDGRDLEALTHDRALAGEPRYSPDGNWIVFVTDQGPGADYENLIFSLPQLAVLNLETRRVQVLPRQAGRNISPFFFPDGRHLLFISDRTGIANLFIRDLETSEDRRITDILTGVSGVTDTSPAASLSRNGRRVVFSSFNGGTFDLFALKDPLKLWEEGEPWLGPFHEVLARFGAGGIDRARPETAVSPMTARQDDQPGDDLAAIFSEENAWGGTGYEPDSAQTASRDHLAPDSLQKMVLAPPAAADATAPPRGGAGASAPPDSIAAALDRLLLEVEPIAPAPETKIRTAEVVSPGRFDADSARWAVDVAEVISSHRELPDPANFEIDRYKPRFSADYLAANGFFASNVGLAAQSVIQFSDVLGDQIFIIGADVYGSLSDSDLLLEYINLKRRINWGVSAFQFRNDFYIFTAEESDQFKSQIYRGVNLTLQRPFSRFRRLEWFVQVQNVSEEVYRESFGGFETAAILTGKERYTYVSPGMALVTDNTIYGSTGPIGGGRNRLSAEVGIGDLSFQTYVLDARRYWNIRQRYAFAARTIVATSRGSDPQNFRIGGVYTLRGYPFGEFGGTNIALGNLEFRFPLIEQLRLGFPLPLSLRGVRGGIFFDVGAAWDDLQGVRVFQTVNGDPQLKDVHASYGISASVNVGFTVLRWDLAWRTDLRRNIGEPRGYFSFGLEF